MADNIRATPRNELLGLLSDAYKWMQSPESTQQMQGFAGLLGTTGLPQTIERMAYGEPLTNIGRANVPLLKPETADALMTVAPFAPAVGRVIPKVVRATEGLPVGMGIKSVGDDIFSLSKQEFLGKPRITKNANAADLKPIELTTLKDVEPQPFMGGKYQIKMNEDGAVVLDKGKPIASYNFGDTLVVDKPYRKSGLAQELVYEWRTTFPAPAVATERTKASQSIQEKVWERIQDEKQSLPQQIQAPQQAALDLAQARAALPIEQGGLGLPANNTAADRAKAMGFDLNTTRFHGSDQDIYAFDPAKFGKNDQGWYGRGVTTDTDPEVASSYAENYVGDRQVVYPLVSRGKYMQWPEGQQPFSTAKDAIQGTKDIQNLGYQGTQVTSDRDLYGSMPQFGTEQVTFDPANIRSRFAAFDPFRKDVATATAMGVALPDLLAAELPEEELKRNQSAGLLFP